MSGNPESPRLPDSGVPVLMMFGAPFVFGGGVRAAGIGGWQWLWAVVQFALAVTMAVVAVRDLRLRFRLARAERSLRR
ncbi:hypothetical protein GCM10027160_30230 [Streptomyces calidiresistens]|uniref:Uncharacterized protein n=1 Tax=Streptomyces calidiresistens TaxID=1485586 RepID=A0A7W3T3V0_9ACTN|nr:hypothetical protein [Streptomyces calidiresistens]MBB0230418.1 hypothetical protein [Streptomyces calidiresistens]